nr:hypothetical protein [Tanacetum cinerariifolium]
MLHQPTTTKELHPTYAACKLHNQVVQNAVQNLGVQNVGNQNGLIVVLGIANQNANQNMNDNVVAAQDKGNGDGNNESQLLIAQKEEAGIQLQDEEFDLMVAAGDIDEIKEVNENCILMENLQQASTSSSQTDKAPVYDSNGSAENVGNQNGLIVVLGIANQNVNQNRNDNVVAAHDKGNGDGNNESQLLIAQKEEAGIQLQDEEFDLMVAAGDIDEIKEVNENCILMENLQQASTSSSQTDKAPVYDSNGSAE